MRLARGEYEQLIRNLPAGESLWMKGIGASLRPFLKSGDSLRVQRCAEHELRVGDIALLSAGPNRLVAHVVTSIAPLETVNAHGVPDTGRAELLGRAIAVRRSGIRVPMSFVTRTILAELIRVRRRVEDTPWLLGQLRLARDAANGPATTFLRKRMLGDVGVRRLEPEDREATLLFLGDHVPDLIEYGNRQFNARWQNEGRAFGAFGKRGMCGFVFIDEYRHEGAPLEGFWIRALLVAPIARGMGLGKRLVEAAVEFGRARQLPEIFADVREENEPSRRLFEGAGFVADPELTRTLNDQRREGPLRGWWIGYRRGL